MSSDQEIEQGSAQDNLKNLAKKLGSLRLLDKDERAEKLGAIFTKQIEKLKGSDKAALLEHPAIKLIEDRIVTPNEKSPYELDNAIRVVGYLSELPASEAANPVFPGFTEDRTSIGDRIFMNVGAVELAGINYTVGSMFRGAESKAFNNATKADSSKALKLTEMKAPEGYEASEDNTESAAMGMMKFNSDDVVETALGMRERFMETGKINPNELADLEFKAMFGFITLRKMADTFNINLGADRVDVMGSAVSSYSMLGLRSRASSELAGVDSEVSIDEIAQANGLNAEQTELLRLDIHKRLAMAAMTADIAGLKDRDGMIGWAASNLKSVKDLFKGQELDEELLRTAPSMDENTIRRMAENIEVIRQADDSIDAARRGLNPQEYEEFGNKNKSYFLKKYVAEEQGSTPEVKIAPQIGIDVDPSLAAPLKFTDYEEAGGDYEVRLPGLSGLTVKDDGLSTGFLTDTKGDGLRLGFSYYDEFTPELLWRETFDFGSFDTGFVSTGLGDFDDTISTPRPGRDDHFSTLSGFGSRFSGDEFEIGNGLSIKPEAFTLYSPSDDELQGGLGLTFDQSLGPAGIFEIQGGATQSWLGSDQRFDAFAQGRVNLAGPFDDKTYILAGVQTTQGMESLTTGYLEGGIGFGQQSNLSAIFGASANTMSVENYYMGVNYQLPDIGGKSLDFGVIVGHEEDGMGTYAMPMFTLRL